VPLRVWLDDESGREVEIDDISEYLDTLSNGQLKRLTECDWKGSTYAGPTAVDQIVEHYSRGHKELKKMLEEIRPYDVTSFSQIDAASAAAWLDWRAEELERSRTSQ